MNTNDEVRRLEQCLSQLEDRAEEPSEAMKELIRYYRDKLVRLSKKPQRRFVPYRELDGVTVVNEQGDREDDI
ncbi:hypothetical protein [Rhizobium changzhiense]|uniref:Uncharacterized protein n=1 Tax=Rhizobium changzhiense TaxID=2692317 RepID=A0ABR6AFD8_9HYPH|nr:hypothetical protein [Rhizobium changzhiense]MBA5805350.1 hypothetical protein [Rhizobium changzhiense]